MGEKKKEEEEGKEDEGGGGRWGARSFHYYANGSLLSVGSLEAIYSH